MEVRKVALIGFAAGFLFSVVMTAIAVIVDPGGLLARFPVHAAIGSGLVWGIVGLVLFGFIGFIYTKIKK